MRVTHALLVLAIAALLATMLPACSSNGTSTADPAARTGEHTATPAAASAEEPAPAVQRGARLPRAQAVQLAEAFVRDQGYTDREPLIRTEIQLESLEGGERDAILAQRRGSIDARSVGAHVQTDGWLVLFAHAGGGSAPTNGRAVRVRADTAPAGSAASWGAEMVHQDAVLPAALERVEVTARFMRFVEEGASCGTVHFAVVAEYEVVEVISGRHDGTHVMVIHGCPELARVQYNAGAGSLTQFRAGELHRMVLVPHTPDVAGGLAIVDANARPELHRYWAERTDPAP